MNVLVSIIIPTFNREKFIEETLASICAQQYKNWEAIIVDDGSTDSTRDHIQKFISGDSRIKFFERNKIKKGASVCRNIGLEKAIGDYVIFLDSDDILAPWCLEQRVECMVKNPGIDFAVFHAHTFRKNPGDGKLHTRLNYSNHLYQFIASHCIWQTMCPIWKKDFLLKIGGFNESYQRFQDAEIHAKALNVESVNYKVFDSLKYDCYFRIDHEKRAEDFWVKVTDAYVYYAHQIFQIDKRVSNPQLFKTAFTALHYFGVIYCLQATPGKSQSVAETIKYFSKEGYISNKDYKILSTALYLFKSNSVNIFFRKIIIRLMMRLCFRKLNSIH